MARLTDARGVATLGRDCRRRRSAQNPSFAN